MWQELDGQIQYGNIWLLQKRCRIELLAKHLVNLLQSSQTVFTFLQYLTTFKSVLLTVHIVFLYLGTKYFHIHRMHVLLAKGLYQYWHRPFNKKISTILPKYSTGCKSCWGNANTNLTPVMYTYVHLIYSALVFTCFILSFRKPHLKETIPD